MPGWSELSRNDLRRNCNPDIFNFKTTDELDLLEGVIGQSRAVHAFEFGLGVSQPAFNIYLSGEQGTGKTSYALNRLRAQAASLPTPPDWCYVYNFSNPDSPMALSFPAGTGRKFAEAMERFVREMISDLPRVFERREYEEEKAAIFKKVQDFRSEQMDKLGKMAEEKGFKLKKTNNGFVSIPLVNGKELKDEEYEQLDEDVRRELEESSSQIKLRAVELMHQVQAVEREAQKQLEKLDRQLADKALEEYMKSLFDDFGKEEKVRKYLEAVREDILNELDVFKAEDEEPSFPWSHRRTRENISSRYQVNLLVDRGSDEGAPVIHEHNPVYYNLIGRIEHEHQFGMMLSDFSMIRPGSLHLANGGYLILQVRDLLSAVESWNVLKRSLKSGQINIEPLGEQYSLYSFTTLQPEPIPLDIKVVLIGSPFFYSLLYEYDEDFRKLFKIKADFDWEMEWDDEAPHLFARFIASYTKQNNLTPFTAEGVARLVEESARLAGSQNKLTTCFHAVGDLVTEASTWAKMAGRKVAGREDVIKAVNEKRKRACLYEDKLLDMVRRGVILLRLQGEEVGQINGLAVTDLGEYAFGRPTRITCTTYLGRSGVINIERETKMSGRIHDKGVLILSGYLGEKFAQDYPLALSAELTFEQLYNGIEGDSASSAELYALLSSLGQFPLKQGIAVTGSVNQKGEIQPVGGINEKVEGFFRTCLLFGLTGDQGVIIPRINKEDLMFSDELVEAVEQGKFHIYAVDTIDQGIELLSGLPAGEKDEKGVYPPDSVNGRVAARLESFSKALERFGDDDEEETL